MLNVTYEGCNIFFLSCTQLQVAFGVWRLAFVAAEMTTGQSAAKYITSCLIPCSCKILNNEFQRHSTLRNMQWHKRMLSAMYTCPYIRTNMMYLCISISIITWVDMTIFTITCAPLELPCLVNLRAYKLLMFYRKLDSCSCPR